MAIFAYLRVQRGAIFRIFTLFLLVFFAVVCPAASVRGVVTDATGA